MPRPITLVDSGGMPITEATWGEPMTPVDAPLYGEPMTLVDSGGVPVVLVEDDLSPWLGAARFAPFAAPSGYRWDFVTENGQTVTERSEPVVALVRVA